MIMTRSPSARADHPCHTLGSGRKTLSSGSGWFPFFIIGIILNMILIPLSSASASAWCKCLYRWPIHPGWPCRRRRESRQKENSSSPISMRYLLPCLTTWDWKDNSWNYSQYQGYTSTMRSRDWAVNSQTSTLTQLLRTFMNQDW